MTNEFHDTLNPKLWVNNKLKPEVANKLKEIANAFIESLEVPREAIEDIVITGSSASYNYTPHSDIDLHLIVDFDKVHKDCPIVGEYLISKKSEFNNNHDIYIYGVPVEVYAEATDNENVHNGLYSLKDGKWIDEPKKLKPVNNDVAVNAKYKELARAIDEVADKDEATQLMDKIKRMRKAGLTKEGEFSVENLVFKKLRNEGYIGKLADIKKEEIDKELSLEEAYKSLINKIEEMCTSTVAMAPYATPVVGQENPSKYEKQGKKRQKKAVLGYKYKKTWGRKMNIEEMMLEIMDTCEAIENEINPKQTIVESLIEEIADVCEAILGRKEKIAKAASTSLPQREEKVKQLQKAINMMPQGSIYANPDKARAINNLKKATERVNQAKKQLGFKPDEK